MVVYTHNNQKHGGEQQSATGILEGGHRENGHRSGQHTQDRAVDGHNCRSTAMSSG